MSKDAAQVKYPGIPAALDGNSAVIHCEREASDGAGAYPITPSTQMGEYWAEAVAQGHLNTSGRPLIFIEPEGEHAAAAVTAGLSMSGLRAANFSSGQGIAYMHESLYAAVGKRLTYVLNVGSRAMTKSTLNVHAGHDDYHCVDDTGFFQLFAKNAQHAADLNIIAHRIAELALNPGIVAQDGFLTTHVIESLLAPERELIADYLGRPDDIIPTPTPAQQILYGPTRRRIPELWDVDNPIQSGVVQNQDAYMQSVAAQRPFFFDHIASLADDAFNAYAQFTGRRYARLMSHLATDADYLIVGQGSVVSSAEAVADYLRATRKLKVGVVNLLMFRPFPGDLLSAVLKGKKGVVVVERVDQPLAADLPLMREIRATVSQAMENGRDKKQPPYPQLASYRDASDAPLLYSACFGLGSRDLQPEGLIGAVENMLPDGKRRKLFYLSVDFVRESALTPKQALHQQTIADAYPQLKELAVHGSENPNLMPEGSVAIRLHSVGGWGAITTGKNLALTLYELLGYHIKANPKYGSEKKGQPTTYYLAAAPEPIRINCEYHYVDAALSPDPNVFHHSNAIAGLKQGGVFVIQSDSDKPAAVWNAIPPAYQRVIVDKSIRVFYLDAFKIAREEATDPDLQLRMQGMAFQGAFFAASPLMKTSGFDEEKLLAAIKAQLQRKFGAKGARVVEDNLRVVKRGYDELREITDMPLAKTGTAAVVAEPAIPIMVKRLPQSSAGVSDIHRFWEQTGSFYARGLGNDNPADPFAALGIMPAGSALFRDMTSIRFQHPQWIAENCTACGACYTVCPDTAIPGLVNDIGQVLDTVVKRVKRAGHTTTQLPKAVRVLDGKLRALMVNAREKDSVRALLEDAIRETEAAAAPEDQAALREEFKLFRAELGEFQFALTRPYFSLMEKKAAGSGGLLSITVNPYACKGCMECVTSCDYDALRPQPQTAGSIATLRNNWNFWLDLPTTPKKFIRVENLEEGIGALETILLDKQVYSAFTGGDGACMGCGEKTVIHLFVATVEALMQPRVAAYVARLDNLLKQLSRHIQLKLSAEIDLGDADLMNDIAQHLEGRDVTLAGIAERVEQLRDSQPVDRGWLTRVIRLHTQLKDLKWRYEQGTTGRGRSSMGLVNATGCTSVWGSTYPFNPYPFPWANHLFQDSPSMAMGVFEGHMRKMAEGFKAVRMAELELANQYNPAEHEPFLTYFDWRQFNDEEFRLCPPVAVIGGDGAMYDIGFQNLSRMMMSGKPIKVVVVDTQVYSNTGGQACTSSFLGQIADMAPYGKLQPGKQEARKEIGLIAMAHRTTYVMQSTIAHPNHMIEGFVAGLLSRRPALFNCYAACQPEHGIGDDRSQIQSKLAVEGRAYPLFRYDPDKGKTPAECFDLDGNPEPYVAWPTYPLKYRDGGRDKELALPLTFADFAMTEARFRKHFRTAPPDTWHENMAPLAEFIELEHDAREGKFPFIWTVDRKGDLSRLLVDAAMVASCEERRDFWIQLKAIAGVRKPEPAPTGALEDKIRQEVIARLTAGLMQMAGGTDEGLRVAAIAPPPKRTEGGSASARASTDHPRGSDAARRDSVGDAATAAPTQSPADYLAPWIDSERCTSCGECMGINPSIFAYDKHEKAFIQNAEGGPYRDLVKAAEKCPAQIIHPGLPKDRSAKDIDKWIQRGDKFNRTS